jgi:hypothetical protein
MQKLLKKKTYSNKNKNFLRLDNLSGNSALYNALNAMVWVSISRIRMKPVRSAMGLAH